MKTREATTRDKTIRLRFRKVRTARFLSHLDLVRLFQKAFRRALLPVARSRGKVPRPKITIPYPLPLGVESEVDVLEVDLAYEVHLDDMKTRLNCKLQDGIEILDVRWVAPGERRHLAGMHYSILGDGLPENEPVDKLMKSSTWKVERKKKDRRIPVDIRPYIGSIRRISGKHMALDLKVEEGRSTRPDEVLDTLGMSVEAVAGLHIIRTEIEEIVQ